jgi:Cd2+/Zn2+-exporting ATPase
MAHTDQHAHAHDCTHDHGTPGCCDLKTPTVTTSTFRSGRQYKIAGMDCAEEVAVLRSAI